MADDRYAELEAYLRDLRRTGLLGQDADADEAPRELTASIETVSRQREATLEVIKMMEEIERLDMRIEELEEYDRALRRPRKAEAAPVVPDSAPVPDSTAFLTDMPDGLMPRAPNGFLPSYHDAVKLAELEMELNALRGKQAVGGAVDAADDEAIAALVRDAAAQPGAPRDEDGRLEALCRDLEDALSRTRMDEYEGMGVDDLVARVALFREHEARMGEMLGAHKLPDVPPMPPAPAGPQDAPESSESSTRALADVLDLRSVDLILARETMGAPQDEPERGRTQQRGTAYVPLPPVVQVGAGGGVVLDGPELVVHGVGGRGAQQAD